MPDQACQEIRGLKADGPLIRQSEQRRQFLPHGRRDEMPDGLLQFSGHGHWIGISEALPGMRTGGEGDAAAHGWGEW